MDALDGPLHQAAGAGDAPPLGLAAVPPGAQAPDAARADTVLALQCPRPRPSAAVTPDPLGPLVCKPGTSRFPGAFPEEVSVGLRAFRVSLGSFNSLMCLTASDKSQKYYLS